MSTRATPPIQQIKESMRKTWMAGDFGMVAKTIAGGGEVFANSLNIPAGARVLDVACGTGNTAIPLARRGFVVTGVDIATNLLQQARERAAAENVNVKFDEGDANSCLIQMRRSTRSPLCSAQCLRHGLSWWLRNLRAS